MPEFSDKELSYAIIQYADPKDLRRLYIEADWWSEALDIHSDFLNEVVQKSACFAGAFDRKKLIGMGRALSDRVSDAYIQDVTVLKKYRGMGIGKQIIQTLTEHLVSMGVDWIGLIAQPGTLDFYRPLGFEPLRDHVAMKYKIK